MKTEVRSQTIEITPSFDVFTRARIGTALGRFAHRIRSVVVRIDDLNGPRGGIDKSCRVQVRGPSMSLILEHRHADPHEAVAMALRRIARSLARRMDLETLRAPRRPTLQEGS